MNFGPPPPGPPPRPRHRATEAEVFHGMIIVSQALSQIGLKFGFHGTCSTAVYADRYGFAREEPLEIDVIIQPTTRFYTPDLIPILQFWDFRIFIDRNSFRVGLRWNFATNGFVVDVPRNDRFVAVSVNITDHYQSSEFRRIYNLNSSRNKRVVLSLEGPSPIPPDLPGFPGQAIPLLNPRWLFFRQVLLFNSTDNLADKGILEGRILQLCDILAQDYHLKKLQYFDEAEIEELRKLKTGWRHDERVLTTFIHCPDVFGPWYMVKWIQAVILALVIVVGSNWLDALTSVNDEPVGWGVTSIFKTVFGKQE